MYLITTENTKAAIAPPETAMWENLHLRTRTGKSFRLKSGLNRQIITIGPQHYRDADGWQDIDNRVQAANSRQFEVTKAPYLWQNHRNGIGCSYKSRKGGFARMRLTSIGGRRLKWVEKPTPGGVCLKQFSVATATDFHWQLKPERVAGWMTLHDATAPREWEWEFVHGKGVGIARSMRGFDGLNRPLEIKCESSTEKFRNGLYRTVLRKRWTGRVAERNPATRAKTWTRDVVWPVAIDPDISEEIVADGDDGRETNGSSWDSTAVWIGYGGYNSNPAFRFQTITVDQADTIDLGVLKVNQTFNQGSGGVGTIWFADEDDAAAWSSSVRPSTKTKTTASVAWTAAGTGQRSFTVTSLLQEVVNRGGFASGNAVSVFGIESSIYGNLNRISDYPSSGNHGRLEIDYTGVGGVATVQNTFINQAVMRAANF